MKMDNYCKEFQHIDPLQSYKPWVRPENKSDMLMPANERQIAAVFVCSDPVDWGQDLQVRERVTTLARFCFIKFGYFGLEYMY